MKAYWVARSKIINKVNYKKYTDLVPDIIEKYNGKILARVEEGERCWSSKEYQKASSFRKNGSGVVDLILVESGDATK